VCFPQFEIVSDDDEREAAEVWAKLDRNAGLSVRNWLAACGKLNGADTNVAQGFFMPSERPFLFAHLARTARPDLA
jgi:hypothetical protein